MEETILNKLKQEHENILMLLLRIESCTEPSEKHELYKELKRELIPHLNGEEKTLYVKLRVEVDDEASDLAQDADLEHREIREFIELLDEAEFNSQEWRDVFFNLKESLLLHFEEEETTLFEEAKEDFGREELIEIGMDYESVKNATSSVLPI